MGQLRRLAPPVALFVLGGVVLGARRRVPVHRILSTVLGASPAWVGVSLVAELGSMIAAAALNRRLLEAAGADLSWATAIALTYASNAVSGSLPAGTAFGTAYTYRQLRRRQVDSAVTTWVLGVAGIASATGLLALTLVGLLLAGSPHMIGGRILIGAAFVCLAAMLGVLGCRRGRATLIKVAVMTIRHLERFARGVGGARHDGDVAHPGSDLAARLEVVRLGRFDGLFALSAATSNWSLDVLTLIASLAAVGVTVSPGRIVLAYALVQLVGAAAVLPGNLGVAEGGLALAVVAGGAPGAAALTGVLLYRVVSYWLLLPPGWFAWLILRSAKVHRPAGKAIGAGSVNGVPTSSAICS